VVSDFLNNPAFSNATAGFNPTASLANTFIQFTGTIFLNAGVNSFVLTQDDGVNLSIGGIGTVLDSPVQTNQVDSFTINAPVAGNYSFILDYVENGNPPAAVQWMYPSGAAVTPAPEPSALLMLGSGMAALGFWRKRVACH
jgi:PEP-CTERM motif